MKILIVTDAWHPQTNGVVTTLDNTIAGVEARGHTVEVLEASRFPTVGLPSYPEIRVSVDPFAIARHMMDARPDAIHIATEGPLGLGARAFCVRHGVPFTTSLHTKFPEYVNARVGAPLSWGYAFLRWFHRPAASTLVTTETQRRELEAWGLRDLVVWGRGVDTERFTPALRTRGGSEESERSDGDAPVLLYVGRVAVEKNVAAFLEMDVPGRKVVVGDGPQRQTLQKRFPDAEWVGYRYGEDLARHYANADVFVFPSRTDTFGLVMLEAMATGTPVAGFPVTGPKDVIVDGTTGAVDEDLPKAVARALACSRADCRAHAEANSWDAIARRFLADLVDRREAPPALVPAAG